jgi:hypothetical protein
MVVEGGQDTIEGNNDNNLLALGLTIRYTPSATIRLIKELSYGFA